MTHTLRVSQSGCLVFEALISELYARIIALLGWAGPVHIAESPADSSVLMGRIAFTIEDALQENLACHAAWVRLCAKQTNIPVDVQVTGLSGTSGADAPREGIGGDGGKGAWPGGGGGGGGAGPNDTGVGGEGADGAIVLFEYSRDGQLVDVEAFVTPGAFKWICPHGVEFVKVIAIGGGGGGSGCRSVSKAVSSDAIRSCESSADLKNRCLNNSIAAPQPS